MTGKLLGAATGAFFGGLAISRIQVPFANDRLLWRRRIAIAFGWAAFAVTAGLVGNALFRTMRSPSDVLTFVVVGILAGAAGGISAALVHRRVAPTHLQSTARVVLAFALSTLSFVLLFRASQVTLGFVLGGLVYGWFSPAKERR